MTKPSDLTAGHLRYYQEQVISPVHYSIEDLESHFDRRDSLYRSLGLPPVAFSNSRVLEVAPGSGQNSLFVASCLPSSYDLVEPNPSGLRDIEESYRGFDRTHTAPRLHPQRLEEFSPRTLYDIVLCENWLGSLPNEILLIKKLATLVAPGGVLVLTSVPLSGFFANIIRKLLALRVVDPLASFEERTGQLVAVFGPHLATIKNMTRSHRDWVHDCMLNPHYLNVALPLETIVQAVGNDLEMLATFPRFSEDWRWFKGLHGKKRRFNEHMLAAFQANTHNFIDYRRMLPSQPVRALPDLFRHFYNAALGWQAAFSESKDVSRAAADIGSLLNDISAHLLAVDGELARAVNEVAALWAEQPLMPDKVRDMKYFGPLFGRETVYVSFTRPRTDRRRH